MPYPADVVPPLVESFKFDCFFNFVDLDRRNHFDNFYRRRKFLKAAVLVNVYFSVCVLPTTLYALMLAKSCGAILFGFLFFCAQFLLCLSGWLVVFENKLPQSWEKRLNSLRRFYIVSIAIVTLLIPCRNIFTTCDFIPEAAQGYILNWHCTVDTVVQDYQILLMALIPVGAVICMCETRFDFVLFVTVFTFVGYAVIVAAIEDTTHTPDILLSCFITLLLCIDQHQFHLEIFLAYDKLAETLAENKRMQEENRAAELRSMIGNLTHDLKTPLQSFIAGIDIMAYNISSIVEGMRDHESNLISSMQSHFDSLVQCFKNIRNTNAFMLMTINRCLDYTKVSKGLTLAPKYDTIDLKDTLAMPLHCMKNIQERIQIEMEEIGAEICRYIITDKQWLQENVLCLLSNAVKYSSEGTVTLSITLKSYSKEKVEQNDANGVTNANPTRTKQGKLRRYLKPSVKYATLSDETISRGRNFRIVPISKPTDTLSSMPTDTVKQQPPFSELEANTENSKTLVMKNDIASGSDEPTDGNNKSVSITNTLPAPSSPSFLRFEVSDHGVGLSEEGRKNLFHPFQQAQRLAGGTGLGLYSLAKRMDAINGHYGLQQRRDGLQGSIFWFEIPYRADETFANMMSQEVDEDDGDGEMIEEPKTAFANCETGEVKKPGDDVRIRGEMVAPSTHPRRLQHAATEVDKLEIIVQRLEKTNKKHSSSSGGSQSPNKKQCKIHSENMEDHSSSQSSMMNSSQSNASITPSRPVQPPDKKKEISMDGWNILIADDSPTITKMISMILRQQHHQVTVAENGEIAIKKMVKHWEDYGKGYDIVLMDLQMPVLDGLEATRRYRAIEITKNQEAIRVGLGNTPAAHRFQTIVGMSANSDQSTVEAAFAAGVNDFIQKPFQMETFHIVAKKLIPPTQSPQATSSSRNHTK